MLGLTVNTKIATLVNWYDFFNDLARNRINLLDFLELLLLILLLYWDNLLIYYLASLRISNRDGCEFLVLFKVRIILFHWNQLMIHYSTSSLIYYWNTLILLSLIWNWKYFVFNNLFGDRIDNWYFLILYLISIELWSLSIILDRNQSFYYLTSCRINNLRLFKFFKFIFPFFTWNWYDFLS